MGSIRSPVVPKPERTLPRLLLALATLGVSIAAWLLLKTDAPASVAPEERAAATAPTSMPATAPSPAEVEPARIPLRTVADREPDVRHVDLRVVLAGTREPVAGARVHHQAIAARQGFSSEQLARMRAAQGDVEAIVQLSGNELVTDDQGRCRLPLAESTLVVARSNDLFGFATLSGSEDGPELGLRPDRTVRVRVLDHRGGPVPGIRLRVSDDADRWSRFQMMWGPTDAHGRYEHRHAQLIADRDSIPVELAALPPGGDPVSVAADLAAPPPEILLTLPPSGTVTIHIVDASGRPIDPVFLDAISLTGPESPADQRLPVPAVRTEVAADGRARFHGVQLDRQLTANNHAIDARVEFAGPTAANPDVAVTLQESEAAIVVTGSFRDGEGQPLCNSDYTIEGRTDRISVGSKGRTDARGWTRCNLGRDMARGEANLTIRLGAMKVELPPRQLRAGISDLGSVQLVAPSVVLAGHLLCEEPLRIADISLQVHRLVGFRWAPDHDLVSEVESDGTFRVCGALPPGITMRLLPSSKRAQLAQTPEYTSGTLDLQVRLRHNTSARSPVIVPR